VESADPETVYAGGLSLVRSSNGGTNYSGITPPHVDMHALAFDAAGALLCGCDGGVYRSVDHGNSWVGLNDSLGVIQFYPGISLHPTNPDFLIGGMQDNGTGRRDADGWLHVLGGDGGYTALHPATPDTMFAEFQGSGNLYRSTNGGFGYVYSGAGIAGADRNCFLPPVTYRPNNASALLYATHRIYRSTNNGDSWSAISGDITGGGTAAVRSLAIAPSNWQTVYAGTNDGRVLTSTDGGATWTLRLTDVPGWFRVKREIAVDPGNDQVAYLAVAHFGVDQVRRTLDRGATWSAIDGDLPDVPVNTIAVQRHGTARTVFAGTDTGVYLTCDEGGHWRRLATGLPHSPVMDLVVDEGFDRLVAATMGRGAWSSALPPPGDEDASGRVDMLDFQGFHRCFGGPLGEPGSIVPTPACLADFDFDLDGDVDDSDYLCFGGRLEGP
jgi:photosystem II stability/assembly factor-like uncharacterized protein